MIPSLAPLGKELDANLSATKKSFGCISLAVACT